MKREIKFRAWDKENKKMAQVSRIDFGPGGIKYLVDDSVLLEYTGLKDKNGQSIYEGDIVRTGKDNIGDPEPMIGQVIMREGSWLIENEKMQEAIDLFSEITSREVIGNIFEDKQLLEGKQ
ncbi:YopX family protein [Lacticaseibacillus paracasei]|uniref:YopX family protein n=1 Tax=Lacticaseibacillus paracasei TaxID=1597 RepID=UPI00236027C3|nr:YopX family protein [Lacticaseibacillus paracasei]